MSGKRYLRILFDKNMNKTSGYLGLTLITEYFSQQLFALDIFPKLFA